MKWIERTTDEIAAGASQIIPLLAPVPTAYLVGNAVYRYLYWPIPVAVTAALAIEGLGLSSTHVALTLYSYNRSRRKTDEAAPFRLSLALIGGYFVTAVFLTVVLDLVPQAVHWAPVVFPLVSLIGVSVAGLRIDHRRRLRDIAEQKAAKRNKARRPENVRTDVPDVRDIVPNKVPNGVPQDRKRAPQSAQDGENRRRTERQVSGLDDMLALAQRRKKELIEQRRERLLNILEKDPHPNLTYLAKQLGIGRTTLYGDLHALQAQGRLRKNGNGMEVHRG